MCPLKSDNLIIILEMAMNLERQELEKKRIRTKFKHATV